jgi:uncharacterized repeat protein (TIGR01451 family)
LLTKTPSKTKVLSGTTVSYLYNATNTGQTPLTGSITDDEFGNVGSFVNLIPGGWVGFNVSHVITANTTNIATAAATDSYGANVTDSAVAFVQVYNANPCIEVTKTGEPEHQRAPGTITWNVTVTNTGNVPLASVNVTDTLHGYLGSIGVLGPGQTIFFVIVETDVAAGVYNDVATAAGWYELGDIVVTDMDCAKCVVGGPDFVVPELPFGTIMAAVTIACALGAFFGISKLRKKRENINP